MSNTPALYFIFPPSPPLALSLHVGHKVRSFPEAEKQAGKVAKEVLQAHNADLAGRGGMDSWHACGAATEAMLAPRWLAELRAAREEQASELACGVAETAKVGASAEVFPRVSGVLLQSLFSEEE
ncbi:hypothetical protein U9M48_000988 [Paspalum notatum var. saurae]|uniref:Uncharacterized protein n=1 Tax=Paspalum notatum var. saurae TaxID=547442 RepID=A0AAQ3SHT0_PASNO